MNFILYNNIFDFLIGIFRILSIISSFIISTKELKNDLKNIKRNNNNTSKKTYFKLTIITLYIIIFLITTIKLAKRYNFSSYISLTYYVSFIFAGLKLFKKNINDLTTDNKITYAMISTVFIVFFSNRASSIYVNAFSNIPHTAKEYMLIIFLSIKIIFFIFCLIIDLSILASNISIMTSKGSAKFRKKLNKCLDKSYNFKLYDFYLSKKYSNKFLILDMIIFVISCPFLLITYFTISIVSFLFKLYIKGILKYGKRIANYFDNSTKVISKTLKISIILSLLSVYIIATYNPEIILENTKDIYGLIITVILIPIIYDSIKSR